MRFNGGKPGWRECSFRTLIVLENLAGEGFVGEACGLAGLGEGQALAFTVEHQLLIVDEGHAVGCGELLGSGADEVDMGTLFKDETSGPDGISEPLDAGYTARFHAAAVHEEGVELDPSIGGEEAAATCIEGGIVFKDGNGGFNGVESGTAARENAVSSFKRAAHAGFVSLCIGCGDGPCAAMDE